VYPWLFHFGKLAIPTYGVLTAVALLSALGVSVLMARWAGLAADKVWNLGLVAIAAHLQAFRAHPFWLLGVATIHGEWIALGGAGIGLAAAVLYAQAEGLPLLRVADALAPGTALGFAINRIGAFCGGLGWGRPTTLAWGVTYRSAIAYVWYRTPLGVKVQPVQLYDAAVSLGILAVVVILQRTGLARRAGEVAGAWLFLYGLGRFFLEFLRGDVTPVIGGMLTVAQGLALVAVVVGGALWMRREAR
jgi:phosphatidylglycerol:prolipoprotein diacylglycerol transferase